MPSRLTISIEALSDGATAHAAAAIEDAIQACDGTVLSRDERQPTHHGMLDPTPIVDFAVQVGVGVTATVLGAMVLDRLRSSPTADTTRIKLRANSKEVSITDPKNGVTIVLPVSEAQE